MVLEGEIKATLRGVQSGARAGDTIHIPANAPHRFHNKSDQPVRLLCIASPAGLEGSFTVPVASPTFAKTGRGRSGRVHREVRSASPEV